MDTAVLTLRGRGDRREGESDVSRQKPATCIRCQVLPMEDSQRQAQRKQHHRPSAEAAAVGEGREWRGVLTREQFGKGRRSREVWLQAKVYLYVSEVCGDEIWQTGEPVFFYKSHMIYNNSPPGKLQKEPRKTPHLSHTDGRKHQQFWDWQVSGAWEWVSNNNMRTTTSCL